MLAVRLASLGCMSLAIDVQGFGQSDGARGYFESFEEVKEDFIFRLRFALENNSDCFRCYFIFSTAEQLL